MTRKTQANYLLLGSFADVPKDLLQEIKQLEEQFTVKPEKLKQITDHFVSELDKGKLRGNAFLSGAVR